MNMFDLEKQITEWRAETTRAGIRNPEVLDELEAHLRERFSQLKQSGMPEGEAFQQALSELGDGASLQREFSKVHSIWSTNRDDILVNLIAAWFILAGVNAITSVRMLLPLGSFSNFATRFLVLLAMLLSSQIFLGVGLFRRREFWRKLALGWSACGLALFLFGPVYNRLFAAQVAASPWSSLGICVTGTNHYSTHSREFYQFLAIPWPMAFLHIISWLNIGMLVLACYQLTRSQVRQAFHKRVPGVAGK